MHNRQSLCLLGALALTGCATEGSLDIRPVGRPSAAAGQPASVRVAIAHGQLAIGNVALALEEFRRAAREEPASPLPLAGMAEAYRAMGRLDLSRRYYERAMALAPTEPGLYVGLAKTLAESGDLAGATAAQAEARARAEPAAASVKAAEAPKVVVPAPTPATLPLPQARSVTIDLAPAQPIARGARLERLSSGEVALLTGGASPWVARTAVASARKVTVQFDRSASLVVLNAARVQGIAARTRDYLAARGFSAARIGDAPAVAASSVIRFPDGARERAARIAAQFLVTPRLEQGTGPLTLIVGRDAARARSTG